MEPERPVWTLVHAYEAVVGGLAAALRNPVVRSLLVLTVVLISSATVFYRYVEGWGWLDSAFFSVVTISTVGYGELVPQTAAGKIFTMVYIFCGIGMFVAVAGAIADQLITRANAQIAERNLQRDEAKARRKPPGRDG